MATEQRHGEKHQEPPKDPREKILWQQELVNERQDEPQEFGGMPSSPVENAEPAARPDTQRETPKEEIEPVHRKRDIQSEGA